MEGGDINTALNEDFSYQHLFELIVGHVSAVIMVVGGVFPYIPQYLQIRRTECQEGFSLYVCLVLIVANTLRIIFWFGHWFETPLLLQSFLMNITMVFMIHCCVTCRNKSQLSVPERIFTDFDYRYFWEWTDVQSYIEFILTFATLGCLGMYVFLGNPWFVETIGFAALITEAMLAAPQFYRNMKNGSTSGMSRKMVLMWLSGDVFKTVYFYLRAAPLQFFVCGALQVLIDLAVIGQCFIYPNKNKSLIK